MSQELSDFLYENNCSVLLKHDSFIPDTQDYLAGTEGAYLKIQEALSHLTKSGFLEKGEQEDHVRLGLSFVVTAMNLNEISAIWRMCRQKNIYPNMELLNPIGRISDGFSKLIPDKTKQVDVLNEIKKIDQEEFGIIQKNHGNHANHCLQHLYSIYLNAQGNIQPCGAIRINKFKYKKGELKKILNNSYFQDARSRHEHLDENVELTAFNVT